MYLRVVLIFTVIKYSVTMRIRKATPCLLITLKQLTEDVNFSVRIDYLGDPLQGKREGESTTQA